VVGASERFARDARPPLTCYTILTVKFCRFLPVAAAGGSAGQYGFLDTEVVREIDAPPWTAWKETGRSVARGDVRLLAPVEPRKIVCIGRNYAAHAAELGNEVPQVPLIFLKPSSAIVGPEEPVVLPKYSQRVEHEGELGLVVGRKCSQLSDAGDPLDYLLGYTCVNDVTARDLQKADVQFTRAKGFDTFCPVGPHIETELQPDNVGVETRVNGEVRQSGRTSLMVFSPAFLVRWLSRMMTLEAGDLIATGTPSGVGPLTAGDTVEVRVEGIGVLCNPVHSAIASF
jgi:2-keto-4-pentenoate hydratase/2-oxohepta-3-ene-1,7-dioic acid hydratase in catechol pathway